MFGNNSTNPNNDTMIQNCPNESVSCVKWSPIEDILLVAAWDGSLGLYKDKPLTQIRVNSPILCGSWRPDGQQALVGACDNFAYLWDIQSNQTRQCALHQAAVKCCAWVDQKMIITTGWDCTIKYWDITKNTGQSEGTINLPERVYCMDFANGILAIGCADKKVRVYDVRNPTNCAKEMETTLIHQFRCLTLFPQQDGVAIGSIEGRVMIQTFNDPSKTFAYKCHRNNDNIFPVHVIKFHQFGTFFTGGGDGSIIFWDKDNKAKLGTLKSCHLPIVDADFSRQFNLLA